MSFSIGLSGLRSTNEQLNVISQNIANVDTSGFKSGRAEFSAIYSGGLPGGVEVADVSSNFDRDGSVINTGRSMDMAISGRGFFVLNNNGETAYTRAGTFNRDASNYIVSNSGAKLQGYPVDSSGALLEGVVTDLQVATGTLQASESSIVNFAANLKADSAIPVTAWNPASIQPDMYNYSQSSTVYDSLGTEHVLTQYFVKTGTSTWDAHYFVDGAAAGTTPTQALTFDASGNLLTPAAAVNLTHNVTNGANNLAIDLSLTDMSQNNADFSLSRNETDGYGAGELKNIRVDDDGSVYGVYTNGQDKLQGKVILADFANPDGLSQGDNTTWTQTFASGAPMLGVPDSGTLGSLSSGAYEGSNVDLTGELVNLMTAQRNYQANAKTISAAEQMTQVLFSSF
ncbi:flagellar hook protein FlgE [Thalassomonas actiniarum]|uniref:Flagellar hook protein FlgE n=1 Tax=Thalassomonas actiniarum TaxID=485447 RepID=A0AAE9YQF7_9GAMM|nr:flagellar hook protein FlgE [Thalassomonas actiniarum]WDD99320.1 flagellar basal body protein FlgE [Thalassomonas actiniarum]